MTYLNLSLKSNKISNKGIKDLFSTLSNLTNLNTIKIDLEKNEINENKLEFIEEEIKKFEKLDYINFNLMKNNLSLEFRKNLF